MKTSKPKNNSNLTDEIDEFLSEAEEEGGAVAVGEPGEGEEEGWGFHEEGEAEALAREEEEVPPEERVTWELNEGDSWDNIIYDPKKQKWERQIKTAMLRRTNALLLLGESGVGKTTMLKKACERYLDTPLSYFNTPNMDPFIHLVGLPHISEDPKTKELILSFVRKAGLGKSELLVLDEINRADPRTQNTLFELVHSRQVNGENLGPLQMVWGAMNPPRSDIEVNVQKLERAFQGRFKKVIVVLAEPRMRHYVFVGGEISEWAARVCLRWWYQFIKGKGAQGVLFQDIITPRVLEYIMETVQFLEDWRQGRVNKRHGPLTREEYNDEFETITQHALLITDESGNTGAGIPLPWAQLRSALRGAEMPGLSDLMDNSKFLPRILARMKKDPTAAKMVASTIRDGIKTTRRQPIPLKDFREIGDFSKVLTSMNPNYANIIISGKPEVAGFLAAKVIGDDADKRKYSKNNMEHPVWKPATPGEIAIFNYLKYPIMMAVKKSAEYEPGAKAGAPGAGAPAPAPAAGAAGGAATPAAPPARPGSVPPSARPGSVPPSARPGAVPPKKPGVP